MTATDRGVEAYDALFSSMLEQLEASSQAALRERIPGAVRQHAVPVIEQYAREAVKQVKAQVALAVQQGVQSGYARASSAGVERIDSEVKTQAGRLEAELMKRLNAHIRKAKRELAPPASVQWEISRDEKGRISAIENGAVRRTPVRDENGKIVRVLEEPA